MLFKLDIKRGMSRQLLLRNISGITNHISIHAFNVVRWGTVLNGICISYDVAGQLFMSRGLCTCILSSKREFIGIKVMFTTEAQAHSRYQIMLVRT